MPFGVKTYSVIDRMPLNRLRRPQDVSRMPDEDRGQLRIPWWAMGYWWAK